MSYENPELQSPTPPSADSAIQPDAPDFVETPDVQPLSTVHEPTPIWLFLICGFALFMTGSSFTGFGSFGQGLYDQGMAGAESAGGSQATAEVAETPMELGKKVFSGNCASCHQASGEGQPGSYPPLVGSEFVLGSKERLAAIILKGIQGPFHVKGTLYATQAMPAQEMLLTPEKIADVMTYIRGSWGNTASAVTPDEVNAAKTKYASRTATWNEADLLKLPSQDSAPADKKP